MSPNGVSLQEPCCKPTLFRWRMFRYILPRNLSCLLWKLRLKCLFPLQLQRRFLEREGSFLDFTRYDLAVILTGDLAIGPLDFYQLRCRGEFGGNFAQEQWGLLGSGYIQYQSETGPDPPCHITPPSWHQLFSWYYVSFVPRDNRQIRWYSDALGNVNRDVLCAFYIQKQKRAMPHFTRPY